MQVLLENSVLLILSASSLVKEMPLSPTTYLTTLPPPHRHTNPASILCLTFGLNLTDISISTRGTYSLTKNISWIGGCCTGWGHCCCAFAFLCFRGWTAQGFYLFCCQSCNFLLCTLITFPGIPPLSVPTGFVTSTQVLICCNLRPFSFAKWLSKVTN